MARRVRHILYVLLFALVCGLGDGPFVDELEGMATGQQETQLSAPRDQASTVQPSALMLVYATLMIAVGASSFPSIARRSATHGQPGYARRAYAGPALARPTKPPRASLA